MQGLKQSQRWFLTFFNIKLQFAHNVESVKSNPTFRSDLNGNSLYLLFVLCEKKQKQIILRCDVSLPAVLMGRRIHAAAQGVTNLFGKMDVPHHLNCISGEVWVNSPQHERIDRNFLYVNKKG